MDLSMAGIAKEYLEYLIRDPSKVPPQQVGDLVRATALYVHQATKIGDQATLDFFLRGDHTRFIDDKTMQSPPQVIPPPSPQVILPPSSPAILETPRELETRLPLVVEAPLPSSELRQNFTTQYGQPAGVLLYNLTKLEYPVVSWANQPDENRAILKSHFRDAASLKGDNGRLIYQRVAHSINLEMMVKGRGKTPVRVSINEMVRFANALPKPPVPIQKETPSAPITNS